MGFGFGQPQRVERVHTLGNQVALAVALLPVANALRDIPRRASRTSVELQGLVQMFVLMLVIEIASLIGNYY